AVAEGLTSAEGRHENRFGGTSDRGCAALAPRPVRVGCVEVQPAHASLRPEHLTELRQTRQERRGALDRDGAGTVECTADVLMMHEPVHQVEILREDT